MLIAARALGFLIAYLAVRRALQLRQGGVSTAVVLLMAAALSGITAAAAELPPALLAEAGLGFGLGACTACLWRRQAARQDLVADPARPTRGEPQRLSPQ